MIGPRTALVLAGCFLTGLVLNLVLVHGDRLNRTEIETVDEPSAVGDTDFFALPKSLEKGAVLSTFENRPLRAVDDETIGLYDSQVVRVSRDDADAHWIYRSTRDERDHRTLKGYLLLKVAPRKYIRVERAGG